MALSELEAYGLEYMAGGDIDAFLDDQRVAILGLPTGDAPYVLPLSFGYDGEDALYFTYLVGEESRKAYLTEAADRASVLVYDVESMFEWRSVSLTGTMEEVPEHRWEAVEDYLEEAWRPELFASAAIGGSLAVYRFDIEERVGIQHIGLAPEARPE